MQKSWQEVMVSTTCMYVCSTHYLVHVCTHTHLTQIEYLTEKQCISTCSNTHHCLQVPYLYVPASQLGEVVCCLWIRVHINSGIKADNISLHNFPDPACLTVFIRDLGTRTVSAEELSRGAEVSVEHCLVEWREVHPPDGRLLRRLSVADNV